MRMVFITLVIVVGLLVLADFGMRHYEESQVAQAIKSSLDLPAQPDVSLHGFPFIAELAQGQISRGTISAASIRAGAVTFSDVRLRLRRLRFSLGQLLDGNLAAIHAAGGTGNASITTASANAYLRAHGAPFQVAFQKGRTIAQLGPLSAHVDVTMTISNGTLSVSPGSGSFARFTVPLPPIFQGISYGSVRPGSGRLLLDFRMQHPSLDLQQR